MDLLNRRSGKAFQQFFFCLIGFLFIYFTILSLSSPSSRAKDKRKMAARHRNYVETFEFFNLSSALKVYWYHAVNNHDILNSALSTNLNKGQALHKSNNFIVGMLEADVINIGGQGYMGHPPAVESDLPFTEFIDIALDAIEKDKKLLGLKIDFKDPLIVEKCVEYLAQKLSQKKEIFSTVPIWLNADILQGPGGEPSLFSADDFLEICNNKLPDSTMSIGWTTGWTKEPEYTEEQIDAMITILKKYKLKKVSFPMHATMLREAVGDDSHPKIQIQNLLNVNPDYTITAWGMADSTLETWLRKPDNPVLGGRVYIDLQPPTLKHSLTLFFARLFGLLY